MSNRNQDIIAAGREAIERDGNRCILCDPPYRRIDPAHILTRGGLFYNFAVKPFAIVALCNHCHTLLDHNASRQRPKWLIKQMRKTGCRPRLIALARQLKELNEMYKEEFNGAELVLGLDYEKEFKKDE